MNTHKDKYCPRCHSVFECKADNILLCQCSNISLSEKEVEYLSKNYSDCLCKVCLEEIKQIVRNSNHG